MTEPGRGRPRSESTRRAILSATRDVVVEAGYDGLTFDAVARRAGASRQTLYRWWASKALLVSDAVMDSVFVFAEAALADTGDLAADLTAWLTDVAARAHDPLTLSLVRALASAAAEDDAHADALYVALTGVEHAKLVARLTAARDQGQSAAHIDPTTTADALLAIPLFHALTRRSTPMDPAVIVRSLVN